MKAIARVLLQRRRRHTTATVDVSSTLFPKQQAFFLSDAESAIAVCSRQAGKTHAAACLIIQQLIKKPDSNVCYIALTRKSAKLIMWRTLKRLSGEFGLIVTPSESELQLSTPQGGLVILLGANDATTAETLRGPAWDLVIIDEAASFRGHIKELIEDVIVPSFITRGGRLRIIGTPTSDFQSYFYQAFHTLPEFEGHRYHWTVRDNIHIQNVEAYLREKVLKRKGWTPDHPTFLREYCGVFARSTDGRVYDQYNPLVNNIAELPDGNWHYSVGVDLGYNDGNAIVVVAHNTNISDKMYIVHRQRYTKQQISVFGAELQKIQRKYKPVRWVCDEGAQGKAIADELTKRFNIPLTPAAKTEKVLHIALVNDALSQGKVLVVDQYSKLDGIDLSEEWLSLEWADEEHTAEKDGQQNELSDCFLYVFRSLTSYLHQSVTEERAEQRRQALNRVAPRMYKDDDDEQPTNPWMNW